MSNSRTFLSFLDLALILLCVFAYAHFASATEAPVEQERLIASHQLQQATLFSGKDAMLQPDGRVRLRNLINGHRDHLVTIELGWSATATEQGRLRRWEQIAARSAVIADALHQAGLPAKQIRVTMPDHLQEPDTPPVPNFASGNDMALHFYAPPAGD